MDAMRQAQVAFYLTGRRLGAELEPVAGLGLRPALMAGYRELDKLRYDYPAVLLDDAGPQGCVRALSALIDDALRELAQAEDGGRVSKQVLQFERRLRAAGADGARLSELWTATAERVGAGSDPALKDSLDRALAHLPGDGRLVDCDAALPGRLLSHAWQVAEVRKAARLRHDIARLAQNVADILRADFARSERGRSPEALKASVGGLDAEAFDFDAMSEVLVRTANRSTLTQVRRHRLRAIIASLESYDFEPGAYRFERCSDALAAWRERSAGLVDVARAMAMAELEIAGDYREDRHDPFFDEFAADGLGPDDLALFAGYLVCVNAATLDAGEQAALMEILSSALPMKVLVQTDDILGEGPSGAAGGGFARSAPHFANMAIGLNDVFVLQAPASHLLRLHEGITAGMDYPGTSLFSVYSGAPGATGGLSAYLVSAAAAESRAFPLFVYDPSAGPDWASRFAIAANPQPEADWPLHGLEYEDAERARVQETIAFTYADFAALDERYARHLARLPAGQGGGTVSTVPEALAAGRGVEEARPPVIRMVDREDRLQDVLVDERLLREARRCLEAWHSLQELGGIHNSHAARRLAEAREQQAAASAMAEVPAPDAPPEPAGPALASAGAEAEPEATEPEHSPDEAWIETLLCTTCNECTQINDKMFAYNENRQAYIADPDAGTYAQLVEAAESCQVSIIHPGKPRNPDEPGLDELVRRAAPFI